MINVLIPRPLVTMHYQMVNVKHDKYVLYARRHPKTIPISLIFYLLSLKKKDPNYILLKIDSS